MNRYHRHNGGFGLIAIIAILAVLAIGGAVAYEVATKNRADVTARENNGAGAHATTSASAEAKLVVELNALRARTLAAMEHIQAGLNAKSGIQTSADAFTDIEADIRALYAKADAETKIELTDLQAKINEVKTSITSKDVITNAITEIKADLGVKSGSGVNVNASTSASGALQVP
jgi:uncharacterized protein HemX